MNVLIAGGSGHLGTMYVESCARRGLRVFSIGSRSAPESWNAYENVDHVEIEIGEDDDLSLKLDDFVQRFGRFSGIVSFAARTHRGIDLELSPWELAVQVGEASLTTWSLVSNALNFLTCPASIVVVSSLWASRVPEPAMYLDLGNEPGLAVPPSKAAQRQLVRYLAVLLAEKGIRVNMVTPGWFPRVFGQARPDYIEQITRRTPLGRIGMQEELIGPLDFLLDERASSFITGQEIVVDGGYSLW